MKIFKKFTCLMVLVLLVASSFSINIAKASPIAEDKRDDSTILLRYNGEGSLTKDSSLILHGSIMKDINKQKGKLYKAKKKNDVVLEVVDPTNELPFDLLTEASEGQFQPVGEKKINVFDISAIENDDSISDYIKEDILKIINNTDPDKLSELSLTVYSPELILPSTETASSDGKVSIASTSGWLPTVYYTGKGSLKYKDEVLWRDNYATDFGSRSMYPKTYAQEQYKKVWSNVGKWTIEQGTSYLLKNVPVLNTVTSFFGLFGGDTAIGGSSSDRVYARLSNEDKWRKYTSVMFPKSDYKLGAVVDRANFEIHSSKYVSGKTSYKNQYGLKQQATQWFSADVKAYEQKASLGHYRETFDRYTFYGMDFTSGIR